MSVPVPGAPPRSSGASAAIGLSFLDAALRLNHVRRVTERLTVTDHRVARRVTEIDVSLRMLDEGQRRASTMSRELRSADPHDRADGFDSGQAHRIWVPVARIARQSAAPVDIRDGTGTRLPRLTQYECSRLLASALHRLLRGILDSLPGATADSDLHLLLHRAHESEWLVQHAIDVLMTERHRPQAPLPQLPVEGVVEGQGARYRALALDVLAKYADVLTEFFALFDVALDDDLLIVALDPGTDEHLLTYETPLHVAPEEQMPARRLTGFLRSSSEGYCLEYRSSISSSVPAYHLVVEAEQGVDIARMYLSTDADARTAATLRADLLVLAEKLGIHRETGSHRDRSTRTPAADKILELQMQTTLRTLADLVRRRRWDAAQAGFDIPAGRMVACTELSRIAVSGEGTPGGQGGVDCSILRHPGLHAAQLTRAAAELDAEELDRDMSLENDPSPSRAHASWRGSTQAGAAGAPVQISAGMLLRDTTAAGPRRVCTYALLVAVVGVVLAMFLAGTPWPFSTQARVRLGAITEADALISVLLLVPGFLYTRLGLFDRRSIAGHLRALPRAVANACITVVAVVAGTIASGLSGGWVQAAFAIMVAVPVGGAVTLLLRRPALRETAELVRLGAPRWLDGGDITRVRGDARFSSVLGGDR